jgi:hypothetical protein
MDREGGEAEALHSRRCCHLHIPSVKLMVVVLVCCSDPVVQALQFLDVINMKDPSQKAHFYRNTLKEVLPYIPRVGGSTV